MTTMSGTQKMNPKISVVITVHNAEKYIKDCLNSVLKQTFTDMEILCMDGGSTDTTPAILSDYAAKDSRIRIINDPNTSYGHKVNRGIEEAKGKYIAALESDDMYEPFMLEKLYEVAQKYHTDFVNGSYTNFFDMNGCRFGYVTRMYQEGEYNCLINYREQPERFGVISRYWTGLFKKEFLMRENIKMNESKGASYQDMSFRFLISVLSQNAYHLDIPVYLYRIDNPGSSMYDSKKTVVIAEEHEFLKQELLKRNITAPHVWHNAYLWKYMDFRGNMGHLKGQYLQELFDRYREELDKDKIYLEKYKNSGYGQFAGKMMTESPEKVMELLKQDQIDREESRNRLYRFAEVVSNANEKQKLIIFGSGQRGKKIVEMLQYMAHRIGCLTDNKRELWGTRIKGYEILSPKEAVQQYAEALYIVANKLHAQEIEKQLQDMGIQKDKIFVY